MRKLYTFLLIFLVLSSPVFAIAEDLADQCIVLSQSNTGCPNLSPSDCRVLLQKCSDYYDQQSAQISQDITKTAQQKNTLASQISGLKKKIQNLEYQISQGNVMVKDLNIQIVDTQASIDKTADQIENTRDQVVHILRSIYEEDKKSSLAVLLEGSLSDFFNNIAYLEGLNSRVSDLLESNKNLKSYLEGQQEKMSSNVSQLQKTIALQTLQKSENEKNKQQQDQYLKLTEAQYQLQMQSKQVIDQQSAKIKAMLFQMVGVSKAPTFGEALEVAKAVAAQVGIRPAFLLAEISQESAIGRNVGQCMLTDEKTGAGKKVSTGAAIIRVMKPTRDVAPFKAITASLGRDYLNTPVSCWIPAYVGGQPYGWGGAMGPAQFIPSTWNLFADRLKVLLGKAADPWAIKDSFMAAGLYLADLGATKQTLAAEKTAASKYYGGSSAYANSVARRADCIQTFIDSGTMTAYCQSLIF